MLCDGINQTETLFELKYKLTTEVGNYRAATIKCEECYDLKDQLEAFKCSQSGYSNSQTEQAISKNLIAWLTNKTKSLITIRDLETSIRKIEPNFQSPIGNFIYYPRISRGY